ncbi:hypothetical protein G7054_g8633 [Neopestalotiopsis clavispora]|nr:hypothetical protein G7054_g8633 [Neopestalotiopsis clavispora]
MSGFEVVGVVLGAIPLILEVVKTYRSTADIIRELKTLGRCLETEHLILYNTCEKLLVSIVPVARIEDYLKDPFGPLWGTEEAQVLLQRRLWKSYRLFEQTVQEMKRAVKELGDIFGMNILIEAGFFSGQSSFSGRLGGTLKLYRKKDQIRELRKIIENGNSTLTKLLATNVDQEVEAARQSQSRGRYLKLTQQCSSNALTALESSIRCQCRGRHSLNLKLPLLSTYPTPADDDEDIVNGVIFEVIFADAYQRRNWSLELHTYNWEQQKLIRAEPLPTLDKISTEKNKQTAESGISAFSPEMMEITNLCHEIDSVRKKVSQIECYGLIKAESPLCHHSFRVISERRISGSSNWSAKSLETLLSSESENMPGWRFRHKQILAAKVASGVLQFSESGWLPDLLTSGYIEFMDQMDSSLFEHPFMNKPLFSTDRVTHQNAAKTASGIPHELLFSLGVVLLEVALGKSLHFLRRPQNSGNLSYVAVGNIPPAFRIAFAAYRDLLADYELAIKHLNEVEQAMGMHYAQAVRHCLKCEFMSPVLDLGQDEFREEVYRKVVAPLEENVSGLNMKFKAS